MKKIVEHIKARRSVRTFDGRTVDAGIKEHILNFTETIVNPFGIPVQFRFMDAKENGLVCPVVSGTELYIGGKIKDVPLAGVAFGYSFEAFVLYAQSLGLGTVWLGGTMNRPAFEAAMQLEQDEQMLCASAVGYPAEKMTVRESVMRKAIKADDRLPFEELFFDGTFKVPLSKEKAGDLMIPLEMVRLAPSAVNRQPWRAVVRDDAVHFYLKRSKGFGAGEKLDMQMIDMGIALCHFAETAKECGICAEFYREAPEIDGATDVHYVASYRLCNQ